MDSKHSLHPTGLKEKTIMFNCYKVFRNGRLYSVVHTEVAATRLMQVYTAFYGLDAVCVWTYEPAFIEGIGF